MLPEYNDSNFDDLVLNSHETVMIDFMADWCGPCRIVGPKVEQAAALLRGKVRVGKVNIDKSPQTAQRCNVRAVPSILVFRGGQCIAKHTGVCDADALVRLATRG